MEDQVHEVPEGSPHYRQGMRRMSKCAVRSGMVLGGISDGTTGSMGALDIERANTRWEYSYREPIESDVLTFTIYDCESNSRYLAGVAVSLEDLKVVLARVGLQVIPTSGDFWTVTSD